MPQSFHAQNSLFFLVTPDRKRVRIVKTDGASPDEGGKVVFADEITDDMFISAFLATSRNGSVDEWWTLRDHWQGNINMLKDAKEVLAQSISRMPKVVLPIVGTIYRERKEERCIVEVVDDAGDPECKHPGNGPYGIVTYTGSYDGSGMVKECGRCNFKSHTEIKMCRHEWVTIKFWPHDMDQQYKCRLCGIWMTTGGCPLNDPRRSNPAERLDEVDPKKVEARP